MNLEELFESLGIDADTTKKVLKGMKENKIYTSGEENLDVRYNKLKTDHDGKINELAEANKLITEMKKTTKDNEAYQTKFDTYEKKVKELEEKNINAAIKLQLVEAKAKDIDYLTFKLNEKLKESGETLQLDEDGNIKDLSDKIEALKTQYNNQFESAADRRIEEHKLEDSSDKDVLTKADILKKSYAERVALYESDKDAYNAAMKQ